MVILFITFFVINSERYNPPGTVHVNDGLYIDRNLVTNGDWKEYVYYSKSTGGQYHMPDTSIYINNKNYYIENNDAPVLLNSIEAVNSYISWRSNFINTRLCSYTKKSSCKSAFYKTYSRKKIGVKYDLIDKGAKAYIKKGIFVSDIYTEINKNNLVDIQGKTFVFRCSAQFIPLHCNTTK